MNYNGECAAVFLGSLLFFLLRSRLVPMDMPMRIALALVIWLCSCITMWGLLDCCSGKLWAQLLIVLLPLAGLLLCREVCRPSACTPLTVAEPTQKCETVTPRRTTRKKRRTVRFAPDTD